VARRGVRLPEGGARRSRRAADRSRQALAAASSSTRRMTHPWRAYAPDVTARTVFGAALERPQARSDSAAARSIPCGPAAPSSDCRAVGPLSFPGRMAQTSNPAANTDTPVAVSPPAGAIGQLSYSGTPRGPDGVTTPDDYQRDMADPSAAWRSSRRCALGSRGARRDRRAPAGDQRRQLGPLERGQDGRSARRSSSSSRTTCTRCSTTCCAGSAAARCSTGSPRIEPVYAVGRSPRSPARSSRGKIRRPTKSSDARHLPAEARAHPAAGDRDVQDLRAPATSRRGAVRLQRPELSPRRDPRREAAALDVRPAGRRSLGRAADAELLQGVADQVADREAEPDAHRPLRRRAAGVEEGEGWTQADRDRLAAFMATWRSSGRNYLMHPAGGKITVVSDDGKTTMSMLEWVKYYDGSIAKTYLTQQSELGSTQTGSRAVGETFFEQLKGSSRRTARRSPAILNERLVKQIVDWNFGPQETYPSFQPSQRVSINGERRATAAALITAKVRAPRPEDEVFARDALGLPSIALETLQQEETTRQETARRLPRRRRSRAIRRHPPPLQAADAPPRSAAAQDRRDARPPPDPRARARRRRAGPRRARHVVPHAQARGVGAADRAAGRRHPRSRSPDVAARRRGARRARAIDEYLEKQAVGLAQQGAAVLSAGVRSIAVPERLRKQLRTVLYEAAQRSRDYGAKTVRNEIARQLAPEGIGPQRDSWIPSTMPWGDGRRASTRGSAIAWWRSSPASPTRRRAICTWRPRWTAPSRRSLAPRVERAHRDPERARAGGRRRPRQAREIARASARSAMVGLSHRAHAGERAGRRERRLRHGSHRCRRGDRRAAGR
jgi:hypothetical protein